MVKIHWPRERFAILSTFLLLALTLHLNTYFHVFEWSLTSLWMARVIEVVSGILFFWALIDIRELTREDRELQKTLARAAGYPPVSRAWARNYGDPTPRLIPYKDQEYFIFPRLSRSGRVFVAIVFIIMIVTSGLIYNFSPWGDRLASRYGEMGKIVSSRGGGTHFEALSDEEFADSLEITLRKRSAAALSISSFALLFSLMMSRNVESQETVIDRSNHEKETQS